MTDTLIQAIQSHAWGVVTGCVLVLIVYAAKLPSVAVQMDTPQILNALAAHNWLGDSI